MTSEREQRRSRSARHYLDAASGANRLETTATLAARALGFPGAKVNILDDGVRHCLAQFGWQDPDIGPRDRTFCHEVVRTGLARTVPDTAQPGSSGDLAVGRVRAYAGVPLHGREGLVVGTLCLVDRVPHRVEPPQLRRLAEFGSVVEEQLDLLRRRAEAITHPPEREAVAGEIAAAIAEGQITPWYEPIVCLTTGAVVAYEALARWQHPTRGLLQAADFVPAAEDSDLVIDLDLSVLRQAAADLRRWRQTDPGLQVSVNLSGRHLAHPDCIGRLREAVVSQGIAPQAVRLELTESAAVPELARSAAFLDDLRAEGFTLLIDDFGTGWASLDHLLHLPLDGVKIDRSFTVALGTRAGSAVTRAVVGLASALGLTVVIEGIETAEQVQLARELGCDFAQGHLWCPPRPASEVAPQPGVADCA